MIQYFEAYGIHNVAAHTLWNAIQTAEIPCQRACAFHVAKAFKYLFDHIIFLTTGVEPAYLQSVEGSYNMAVKNTPIFTNGLDDIIPLLKVWEKSLEEPIVSINILSLQQAINILTLLFQECSWNFVHYSTKTAENLRYEFRSLSESDTYSYRLIEDFVANNNLNTGYQDNIWEDINRVYTLNSQYYQ